MTMKEGLWVCEILYGTVLVAMVWHPVFKEWRMGKAILAAICSAGDSIAWILRHRIKHQYLDLIGALSCMLIMSYVSSIVGIACLLVLVSVAVQILISKRCRRC